jgi:ribosomal-protein-alanine N-acetyltransferase
MIAPLLETKSLYLKPLGVDYCSLDYVNWLNDAQVIEFLETKQGTTLDSLLKFLEQVESRSILFWAIVVKENNVHIGNIKIDPIKDGVGEYGIMIGHKSYWGKGLAKEASAAVIDYCFNKLALRKITLGFIEQNTAALHLYTSMGFEVEGVLKKQVSFKDTFSDVIRMGLLKENWKLTK